MATRYSFKKCADIEAGDTVNLGYGVGWAQIAKVEHFVRDAEIAYLSMSSLQLSKARKVKVPAVRLFIAGRGPTVQDASTKLQVR
jgi:hypothetical protein